MWYCLWKVEDNYHSLTARCLVSLTPPFQLKIWWGIAEKPRIRFLKISVFFQKLRRSGLCSIFQKKKHWAWMKCQDTLRWLSDRKWLSPIRNWKLSSSAWTLTRTSVFQNPKWRHSSTFWLPIRMGLGSLLSQKRYPPCVASEKLLGEKRKLKAHQRFSITVLKRMCSASQITNILRMRSQVLRLSNHISEKTWFWL